MHADIATYELQPNDFAIVARARVGADDQAGCVALVGAQHRRTPCPAVAILVGVPVCFIGRGCIRINAIANDADSLDTVCKSITQIDDALILPRGPGDRAELSISNRVDFIKMLRTVRCLPKTPGNGQLMTIELVERICRTTNRARK